MSLLSQLSATVKTNAKDSWDGPPDGDHDCDLLVIGSGAGGLAAAVTAAALGLSVIVAEKAPTIGGTAAWSGGWLWVPRNPLAIRAGVVEPDGAAQTYLRSVLGNAYEPGRIETYLDAAPRMLEFFEQETELKFLPGAASPDFHATLPGGVLGWRSVVAAPYDATALGPLLARLRPPIPETTFHGLGIAPGKDLAHFLNAFRSPASFFYVTKRLARYARDRVVAGRSRQLCNGNALVARLLRSADDRGVRFLTSSAAVGFLYEGERVSGAILNGADSTRRVRARLGVVLATGGFPHDPARLKALLPHVQAGTPHFSAAPLTNTGDGMRLAEQAGGRADDTLSDSAAWAPVSLTPQPDGETGRFPHLIERGKPGLIAVTRDGARFVNEAGPYHDFMRALFEALPEGEPVQAWLICDHRFLRRYGLGAVQPFPVPIRRWLRNLYLKRGKTLPELALACGIDPQGLAETVAAFNRHPALGQDPQFGRGETPYQRAQGDSTHHPNPCVAPLIKAPFYAVRVVPGSLGTFAGIVTDDAARVLRHDDTPVPGLYAVGNDMTSIMRGAYPSGGITLGPAMTFGWLAARQIAADAARADSGLSDRDAGSGS